MEYKYGSEQDKIERKGTLKNYHIAYLGEILYRRSAIPSLFDVYINRASCYMESVRNSSVVEHC